MPSPFLRDVFSRLLGASLAAPLALSACGPPPIDDAKYQSPVCDSGLVAVSGLKPSVISDVIQLRQVNSFGSGQMPTEQLISSDGTVCKTATNQSVCQSTITALKSTEGFRSQCSQICTEYYLATTAGDEVKAVKTLEALRGFLGTIDTPQEAALLVFASGLDISCTDKQRGAVRALGDGFEVVATDGFACGPNTRLTRHVVSVSASGELKDTKTEVLEVGKDNCAIGRRPDGLQPLEHVPAGEALGRHFALVARLEAAAVRAFMQLHDELVLHHASGELQLLALVSAAEEIDHTNATVALAKRFGGVAPLAVVEQRPLRSLFELALDNAVEGCVRETYGALLAHHQALHAQDPQIRETMVQIADDETRHADLSWKIHQWALPQLTPAQVEQIRAAQRDAVMALRHEALEEPAEELRSLAGLPDASASATLVDRLATELWSDERVVDVVT